MLPSRYLQNSTSVLNQSLFLWSRDPKLEFFFLFLLYLLLSFFLGSPLYLRAFYHFLFYTPPVSELCLARYRRIYYIKNEPSFKIHHYAVLRSYVVKGRVHGICFMILLGLLKNKFREHIPFLQHHTLYALQLSIIFRFLFRWVIGLFGLLYALVLKLGSEIWTPPLTPLTGFLPRLL